MNKRILGYVIFTISCILWLVPLCVGFFDMQAKQIALITTASFVLAEALFLLSIVILGKEFWNKIKRFFKMYWQLCKRKFWRKTSNS